MPDLFEQPDCMTLTPCQSLALRRMINAMKADAAIYTACPDVVRSAIADILLPPYSSAETHIAALEDHIAYGQQLLEKFGARIRELERRRG